jgi:acyl-[acyl-carrier-protein] desaturase
MNAEIPPPLPEGSVPSYRRCLSAQQMGELAEGYFRELDKKPWNRFTDIPWESLQPEQLPAEHRSALVFITFIEDHLPGYFQEYQRAFPLHPGVPIEDYAHHRELYHFTLKWAVEEDAHAHVLSTYQLKAGLETPESLRSKLAEEGRKPFILTVNEPVQVFTYTLIQEKATQIFYQQFAKVVTEPVLRHILLALVRDEARHFAFFSRVMQRYIQVFGAELLPAIKDTLMHFKMPLSSTLRGYWRWALRISDAVGGYDHSEAYEDLVRVIQECADAPTWSKAHDLVELVKAIRATSA